MPTTSWDYCSCLVSSGLPGTWEPRRIIPIHEATIEVKSGVVEELVMYAVETTSLQVW